jgi:catechol 2,3-dioxygenase
MTKQSIKLGPIVLQHKNIKVLSDFYTQTIGLEILEKTDNEIVLGSKSHEILRLVEDKDLKTPDPKASGLYHLAILFPNRARLSKVILKLYSKFPELVEGSSDHGVSEAFYFTDPLGNGVELYFDKPRSLWSTLNGKPIFKSDYLDPTDYVAKYIEEDDDDSPLALGHIHLYISHILNAKEFYVDILKFDIMATMSSALFISYDDYHHHIGLNTWKGINGPKMEKDTEGLKSFTINYLDLNLYKSIIKNLESKSISFEQKEKVISLDDPFGIKINLIDISKN